VLACGLSLATGVLAPAGDDKDDDMRRIQGTRAIHPAMYKHVADKKAIESLIALSSSQRVIFDGNSVTFHSPPGNDQEGRFRLDSTKKPKQFDLSDEEKGIYELEGDTLKLCWDHEAKTNGRPTKFAHDEDKDSVHYLFLKRAKKK
jgi:uncharacterized protein (TIGR03067 family)